MLYYMMQYFGTVSLLSLIMERNHSSKNVLVLQ